MQQAYPQRGFGAIQGGQHGRQQAAGSDRQRAHGDGERIILQQPLEGVLRAAQLAEHDMRGLYQHLAHRIGAHAARMALEQRCADDLFDLLQGTRQCGLGDVQHA